MFRPVRFSRVSLIAVALLSSTALTSTGQAVAGPVDATQAMSPYAVYLAGRHALASGDMRDGAAAMEALAARFPDQPALRREAFQAALFAGDIDGAAALAPDAPDGQDRSDMASLGRIVRAVRAITAGKGADATAQLDLKAIEIPHRPAALVLAPWAAAEAGNWTAAVAEPPQADRLSQLVVGLSRAELLEIKGKKTEAEAAYREITDDAQGQKLFKPRYGEFLERAGRTKEALAYYDAALKLDPDNAELSAARDRAARGGSAPAMPTLRQGASRVLTFSALQAAARNPSLSLAYIRLALALEPTNDRALLMLGDILTQSRDPAGARQAWAAVPESSWLYVDARSREAYGLSANADLEGAIKLARATAAAKPLDPAAQFALADILRTADRNADALVVLDKLTKGEGGRDWRVRYMRAIALDKVGRWPDAEADLKLALELSPDQPDVENYLGYSWIDHGDHIQDGLALVEKAVAARPNSGAMQDSLGWARYRLGQYVDAVNLLEKAVELEPSDPDINDHLGDAYWKAGRKDEAGFQWNRVLTLSPDAKLKTAIEHKLHDGLASAGANTGPLAAAR